MRPAAAAGPTRRHRCGSSRRAPRARPAAPPRPDTWCHRGSRPRLPRPPSPACPLGGASARPARPTLPRALPTSSARPSLSAEPDPGRACGGSKHLQQGDARHPLFGTWYRVRRGCTSQRRTQKSCDITESQTVERESFCLAAAPCPLDFKSTYSSPHNYLAGERRGGPPPPGPQPSESCTTDTASGLRNLKGCDSPWGICIRRAWRWQRSTAGTEGRGQFPRVWEARLLRARKPFSPALAHRRPGMSTRHAALGTPHLNSENRFKAALYSLLAKCLCA